MTHSRLLLVVAMVTGTACGDEIGEPLLLDSTPTDGATDVAIDLNTVSLTFSEPLDEFGVATFVDLDRDVALAVSASFDETPETVFVELQDAGSLDYDGRYELTLEGATTADGWIGDLSMSFRTEPGPNVVDVSVLIDDAPPADMSIGDTAQLSARAFGDSGEISDADIEWSTVNSRIATVNSNGLLTAVSAGTTTVTVDFGDASDDAIVTVVDPCEPLIELTYMGSPIVQNVEALSADCLSDASTYASNISLVVPEQTSFYLEASQTGGGTECSIRFFDEDGTQVVDAFNGFPNARANLDAGTYRVEFASQDSGLTSSATLTVTDVCDAPRGTGLSTTGSPTQAFTIDDSDCFDANTGLYRYDVAYTTNFNDLPGTTTLTVTLDNAVPTFGLTTTADGNPGREGTLTNSTGTSWTHNYSGRYRIEAEIYASEPVSGTVRVTR